MILDPFDDHAITDRGDLAATVRVLPADTNPTVEEVKAAPVIGHADPRDLTSGGRDEEDA